MGKGMGIKWDELSEEAKLFELFRTGLIVIMAVCLQMEKGKTELSEGISQIRHRCRGMMQALDEVSKKRCQKKNS